MNNGLNNNTIFFRRLEPSDERLFYKIQLKYLVWDESNYNKENNVLVYKRKITFHWTDGASVQFSSSWHLKYIFYVRLVNQKQHENQIINLQIFSLPACLSLFLFSSYNFTPCVCVSVCVLQVAGVFVGLLSNSNSI